MGYRSDLVIAHSFIDISHMQEVFTAWSMDKRYAEYDLSAHTKICEEKPINFKTKINNVTNKVYTIVVIGEQWKWYEDDPFGEGYQDVHCINSLRDICRDFKKERNFPYAYKFIRIGEDPEDEENREEDSGCVEGETLAEHLESSMFISRQIDNNFIDLMSVKDFIELKEREVA